MAGRESRPPRCGLFSEDPEHDLDAALAAALREQGCAVELLGPAGPHERSPRSLRDERSEFSRHDLLVVRGDARPRGWLPGRLEGASDAPLLVYWLTEQLPSPDGWAPARAGAARLRASLEDGLLPAPLRRRAIRLRLLGEILDLSRTGRLGLVCCFSETQASLLRKHGVPAEVIPFGHAPHLGLRLDLKRDIDLLFMGNLQDRRRRSAVERVMRALRERGRRVRIVDGDPRRPYLTGVERSVLLNRSRLMLGMPRRGWDDMMYRFLLSAANGLPLVSTPLRPSSRGPLLPDEHYVEASLEALPERIEALLESEAERGALADRAHAHALEALSLSRMVARMLESMAPGAPAAGS